MINNKSTTVVNKNTHIFNFLDPDTSHCSHAYYKIWPSHSFMCAAPFEYTLSESSIFQIGVKLHVQKFFLAEHLQLGLNIHLK